MQLQLLVKRAVDKLKLGLSQPLNRQHSVEPNQTGVRIEIAIDLMPCTWGTKKPITMLWANVNI